MGRCEADSAAGDYGLNAMQKPSGMILKLASQDCIQQFDALCITFFERIFDMASIPLITDWSELSDFRGCDLAEIGATTDATGDWDRDVLARIAAEYGVTLPSTKVLLTAIFAAIESPRSMH